MNFFKRKKTPAALESRMKIDPTTLVANTEQEYLARGLAFHARGKNENAEADTLKALAMNSKSVDGHFNLGLVYKTQGLTEKSIASFQSALDNLAALEETDAVRALLLKKLINWHIKNVSASVTV